jgi:hypothetical protein
VQNMKLGKAVVVAIFCLILTGTPVMAASGHQTSALSLTMGGLITDAGQQHYKVGGGQIVAGEINGQPVDSSDQLSFSLNVMVHGLGTSGTGSLSVSGPGMSLSAQIPINSEVAAAVFPIDPDTGASCNPAAQSCNSQIPLLFLGVATVHMGAGQPLKIPIGIESPYWSPFGGPILITSLESTSAPMLFMVVTYSSASIDWTGVQLQGQFGGLLGAEPVTGSFAQVTNSHEDLVNAIEQDSHTIAFTGASDPVLNAMGTFSGQTTFSLVGSIDCANPSSPVYFPGLPEGTCTATGASSAGTFQMVGAQGAKIAGTYETAWSVPSLFTSTTVLGAVVQH